MIPTLPLYCAGRFLVQSALRADLKALEGMLDCFESQFKAGRPLTVAQKRAATQFLSCFLNFIRRQYLSGRPAGCGASAITASCCTYVFLVPVVSPSEGCKRLQDAP